MPWTRWTVALVLTMALAFPAWAGPEEDAAAGIAAARNGECLEASQRLSQALSSGKYLPPALRVECLVSRGYCLGMRHEYVQAIADYNQALKLDPNNADAYYFRGLSHFAQGQTRLCLLDLNKAVQLKPDDQDYKRTLEKVRLLINPKKTQ